MVAAFTKGHNFTTNETVNDADLHEHIESATVANISRDNIDNTDGHLGLVRSSLPADLNDQEPWCHTDIQWWCTKAGGTPASMRVGGLTVKLDAGSAAVEPGELVSPAGLDGTTILVTKATTSKPYAVLGSAAYRANAGDTFVIVTHGITRVQFSSSPSGDDVGKAIKQSSGTDGQADVVAAAGSGGTPNQIGVLIGNVDATSKLGWVILHR